MQNSVEIVSRVKARVSPAQLQKVVASFFQVTKTNPKTSISIAIVGTHAIKKLNKKYRKSDSVTDVLSFSYKTNTDKSPSPFLGEVLICYPRAASQAKQYKHSVSSELSVLLTHGLVHLLGYDHRSAKNSKKMASVEQKILDKVGNSKAKNLISRS